MSLTNVDIFFVTWGVARSEIHAIRGNQGPGLGATTTELEEVSITHNVDGPSESSLSHLSGEVIERGKPVRLCETLKVIKESYDVAET